MNKFKALLLFCNIILLSVANALSCFSSNPDSLKRLLPNVSKEHRVTLLNDISEAVAEGFPENAIAYSSEAYQLARKMNNLPGEARALKLIADATFYLNNFRDAIGYYERSAAVSEKLTGRESYEYLSRTGDIGFCYLRLNNNAKALEYFNTALELSVKTGNSEEIANNSNNIGFIYAEWGDYGTAITYFQKSMEIDKKSGRNELISTDLNNIGKLYESWGKYEQAIKCYTEALRIDESIGNKKKIALRWNNIGMAFKECRQYDTALNYLQKSLAFEQSQGDKEKIGKRLFNIGSIFYAMRQFDKSIRYYDQASVIFEKLKANDDLSLLYNSYGNYYLETLDYNRAIENLQKSCELALKNNLRPILLNNYLLLSRAYIKIGNSTKALETFNTYASLKDSIITIESDKKLAEFMAKYGAEKVRLENEVLKKNARIRDNIFLLTWISLAGVLLIMTAIIFILRLRAKTSRQAKEISEQKAEKYMKDLEIKNNELTYNAMCIIRNNESVTRMIEQVENGLKIGNSLDEIQPLLNRIKSNEHEQAWREFEVRFTRIHNDFYELLNNVSPDLTPNEKKLCAFLRLNMTTKDIASITHQSLHSINIARGRLRKKLNLVNSDENLVNFLMKL